jgi:ornithine cyclodeaminase/alanine dehydrogenase
MRRMVDVIEAGIREQAAGRVVMPVRQNLVTSTGFFRVMPCVMRDGGRMGIKIFNGSVEHGVRYIVLIYDERGGELLCLMDAAWLTGARTGATTGVATRYQARKDARTVGVIGSGLEARTNFAAVCAVRTIEHARVYSPNPERRARFAVEMGAAHGVTIEPVSSPEAAVAGVDIVVVATNTTGHGDLIAYRGAWLEPGQHVNSIGATGGLLREIDPDCFARAACIQVDSLEQVRGESGDATAAIAAGAWEESKMVEMPTVVAGTAPARTADDQITLFKSVGTAVQDVMAGFAVYEQARRLGIGQEVPEFLEHKRF